MKKEYILRSDLALQNKKYKKVQSIKLDSFKVEQYGYKDYLFIDILFKNIETDKNKKNLKCILVKELKNMLKKYKLSKNDSCLIVGLGNKNIISDALGVLTCQNVVATGYFPFLNITNYRDVYVYVPGTTKESGLDPFKGIKALVRELKPRFMIVIDSLVCSHINYLNSVIQVSDYGIRPGSGMASYNEEISFKTTGIPVIVLGVPTVTFASTIIRDVMNIKKSHISFKKGYDFMVVAQDVDLIIKILSKIIGEAINDGLNNFKSF